MIGDHRRREESRQLEPAVTIRRAHHGNVDAHVPQSSDAICPVSFDWGAPLEVEAKLGEELNGGVDVFYHYADVVHTLDGHDVSIQYRRLKPYRVPNSCHGDSLSATRAARQASAKTAQRRVNKSLRTRTIRGWLPHE